MLHAAQPVDLLPSWRLPGGRPYGRHGEADHQAHRQHPAAARRLARGGAQVVGDWQRPAAPPGSLVEWGLLTPGSPARGWATNSTGFLKKDEALHAWGAAPGEGEGGEKDMHGSGLLQRSAGHALVPDSTPRCTSSAQAGPTWPHPRGPLRIRLSLHLRARCECAASHKGHYASVGRDAGGWLAARLQVWLNRGLNALTAWSAFLTSFPSPTCHRAGSAAAHLRHAARASKACSLPCGAPKPYSCTLGAFRPSYLIYHICLCMY